MTVEKTLNIQQAIDLGKQRHQAGDLPEAEGIYQRILQADPNQPVALHLLGVIAHQFGKNDIATELITKAISIRPDYVEAYSNLGLALKGLGQLDEAVASYNKALAINPDHPEVHNNLGIALKALERLDAAVVSYNKAIAINPDYAEALCNLGDVLQELGDFDEAVANYNKAIAIKPDYAEAYSNLGNTLRALGLHDDAVESYNKAIAIKPDFFVAHNNLGNTLQDLGQIDAAVASYNKAFKINPNFSGSQINLCNTLMRLGRMTEALEHITNALKLSPNDINAKSAYSKCLELLVPLWHTPMMNDELRNNAYLKALQSAVKDDSHVLEIGTGSGIISMMAARCKAEKITTCEMSPLIAQTAKDIIEENGFSDSINVIPIKSTNLKIGIDLPRRSDILVSEILSSELLGEGVLSSIEDAKKRLLSPDAQIIPREASIRVALFGGDHIGKSMFVDNVNGFDLSKFNRITSKKIAFDANFFDVKFLSNTVNAFTFDFMEKNYFPPEEKFLDLQVITSGKCYGVMQWIHMQMDDTFTFENNPLAKTVASGWTHVFYLFDTPLNVTAKQVVKISAAHDRNIPWFTLESVS